MLKFIKHHMTSILGIEIWPVIAFVIFFTFFIGMLWYVLTFSKRHIAHMEQMPFDDNRTGPLEGTTH